MAIDCRVIATKIRGFDCLGAHDRSIQVWARSKRTDMVEGRLNQIQPVSEPAASASRWRWWIVGLSICGGVSTIAAAAFWWLTILPPVPECNQISQLSPDRDRLYCAQAAAESGDLPQLLAGIDSLKDWTPDRPLYHEAQRWMGEWSESVLQQAWRKLEHSDLDGAIALARRIPSASPAYDRAQAAIANWQQQQSQGEAIVAQAQAALRNQQWDRASEQIVALNDLKLNYWKIQSQALRQQLATERRAHQVLTQARQLAQSKQPAQLGAAIDLISQMNPKTYAWAEAQAQWNQWGDSLLKHGLQQWQQQQLDGAIATARLVKANPNLAAEAQNLLHLSQARQLAIASTAPWQTSPLQLAKLSEAVAAARQVKSTSRFYPQAQTSLKDWQAYLEDLQQLQFAQATASLGHRVALFAAIEQAQQIAPDRPRRLQAQTLIAHWKREIQQQEDRPHLVQARQLAKANTIPALQQAIVAAQQIPLNRALRPEAQGLIYVWRQRIQTIEDQPILDRARSIARQGKLGEAIRVARQIPADRALSTEARLAIRNWQGQIRARELARIQAIREQAAEATRRRQARRSTAAIEPQRDVESIAPLPEDASPSSAETKPSRQSPRSEAATEAAPPVSRGSISPPERIPPQRQVAPPAEPAPLPAPQPPAAPPVPAEPAPPPVAESASDEKLVPALP